MANRKLSKADKKAIMDKHGSVPASEVFTDDEWTKLMFAEHSEIKDVMLDIINDSDKKCHRLQKISLMTYKTLSMTLR
jgi:hypothetical protein